MALMAEQVDLINTFENAFSLFYAYEANGWFKCIGILSISIIFIVPSTYRGKRGGDSTYD